VADITLWQLGPSFNSRKVRYALGVKGAKYNTIEVNDANAAEVVAVSGQPLTPVIKHGTHVMFDSGAIVRYIDANIEGPRLFSTDSDEMRAIESWEVKAKQELLAPYMQLSGQVRSGEMNADIIAAAKSAFFAAATTVDNSINKHGYLVGDSLTAADVFCGCYLAYGFLTDAEAGKRPPLVWAKNNIALTESHPKLTTWFEQLRALDNAY
jgi:glutathione S-transferase